MKKPIKQIAEIKPKEPETWNKQVGIFRKYQVRDHYKQIYSTILAPQLKNRYVFFRVFYGPKSEIKRHPSGDENRFIEITSWPQLENWIRMHAVEIVPELATKDEIDRTTRLFIEFDVKGYSGHDVYKVFETAVVEGIMHAAHKERINIGRLDIRDSGGKSVHLYVPLFTSKGEPLPITYTRARRIMKQYVISSLVQYHPEIIETNIQKLKSRAKFIFPDISSLKTHGGARAIGSLHARTGLVCRRINAEEIKKIDFGGRK